MHKPNQPVRNLKSSSKRILAYMDWNSPTGFGNVSKNIIDRIIILDFSFKKVSSGPKFNSPFLPEKHRLINTGQTELHLIEIQTGNSFSEDDIIRYEDLYNRIDK